MGGFITQLFPPSPTFTEANIPSLAGKVYIVTGGNSGVGLETVKILYSKGSTVYIASRSPVRIADAIAELAPAPAFLSQESRLDVLFNNAGLGRLPLGTISAQGHEALMAINCLGPFLLTKLLLPILLKTAKSAPKESVRIVWASSGIIDMNAPPGGLSLAELAPGKSGKDVARNYSASKTGKWFLASEFDKRIRKDGIISVTQSPGTLKTKGWDGVSWPLRMLFKPVFHEPKMGAYTTLWCGLSGEVKSEDGGRYAIPWGRWHMDPRNDILESLKGEEEGGTGVAREFWDWCEEQMREFAGIGGGSC